MAPCSGVQSAAAKHVVARLCRGGIRSASGIVRATAAVDLQSSPPLALLAGVNRHCLEVDYGGRKVS